MTWRRPQKLKLWAFGVAMAVTAVMGIVYFIGPRFLEDLENKTLDFRFLARGTAQPSGAIGIVAIDERSIKEFGRWPWSRDIVADLVRKISAAGAKVIAIDVIYSEPEITERLKIIQDIQAEAKSFASKDSPLFKILEDKRDEASADEQFAQAIRDSGNVVLAVATLVPESMDLDEQTSWESKELEYDTPFEIGRYAFVLVRHASAQNVFHPIVASDILPPLPKLAKHAKNLGHVYALPDKDGVIRYGVLTVKYNEDFYPSLPLASAQTYLELPPDRMSLQLGQGVTLGDIVIPTDERGRMLLHHYGKGHTFPYYSAAAVLKQEIPPGTFRDKIVFIGTSAVGTFDLRVTPFDANLPGVEINATVAENILQRQFLHRSEVLKTLDLFALVIGGILAGLIIPQVRGLYGTGTIVGLLVGYALLAQSLFVSKGLWINVVYPLSTMLLCYIALTVLSYLTEERRAREIRAMFASYVNPRIVEALIKTPEAARLGGFRRNITLLFSDIRGFTTFSEKNRAEDVVDQLNTYLKAMTEEVFSSNGTLDKFVGDALMVFWGAPVDQPDHARLGLQCALNMRKRLYELNEKWADEGKQPFSIGIGLHTGEAVVGNMGAQGMKTDYTAIGDTVNLAARLEGTTKQYGVGALFTEDTYLAAQNSFETRKVDYIAVKGKGKPVWVYELLGEVGGIPASTAKLRDAFESALAAYRKRNWGEAEKHINECLTIDPQDGPALVLKKRIQIFRQTPPADDWDGSWQLTEK